MTVTEACVGLTLPDARPLTAVEVASSFDLLDRLLALPDVSAANAGPIPENELRRQSIDGLTGGLAREINAGIPHVRLHDLRSFSATMVARHGATTKELMHRLGHSTPDMALRYLRAEADRDAQLARANSAALTPHATRSSLQRRQRKKPVHLVTRLGRL